MRQVARGEIEPTIRLHRTGPILAFGRLDRLRPGYRRAVEIAREHGYVPVERLAGGRAAVFHEGTISFSHAIRAAGGSGAYAGTRERFAAMADDDRGGARRASASTPGSARCAGEYCPGEFSVNARGAAKLAGIGQRVIVGGAHVGGVIVVRGAGRIRESSSRSTRRSRSTGTRRRPAASPLELGEDDDTIPGDKPDPLIDRPSIDPDAELAKTLRP